jgi:hypothetical protein
MNVRSKRIMILVLLGIDFSKEYYGQQVPFLRGRAGGLLIHNGEQDLCKWD